MSAYCGNGLSAWATVPRLPHRVEKLLNGAFTPDATPAVDVMFEVSVLIPYLSIMLYGIWLFLSRPVCRCAPMTPLYDASSTMLLLNWCWIERLKL